MRALTYQGPRDVRVETVPDPSIIAPDDLILRVTASAICGSDLHIFHGKVLGMRSGDILGHEFMGIVEEVGPEVTKVKKGDRVVIPFAIACGDCYFCHAQLYSACEVTNPDPGGSLNKKSIRPPAALYGYSHLYGGVPGGQAEFVRVPKGNANPFKVPTTLEDAKVLFLSDILPTGYQATVNAGVEKGSRIVIYGAGPVGWMTAACARLLGAEQIYMVDHHPERLAFAARHFGAIPIDFDQEDPAGRILEETDNRGVDAAIDAVGFEAKGSRLETTLANLKLEGGSGAALRQCIAAVRRGGTVSIPGVYIGFLHGFLLGDAFDKGLTFKMGQTHVHRYLSELLEHVEAGRLQPDALISHHLSIDEAAEGYALFDAQPNICRKVLLTPAGR
jgi:threonine dehydrogenase-like Zn-dependent dehydrogenase